MAVLWIVLASSAALGADIPARVVGVSDGDTVTVLTANRKQLRVRISGIDGPESKQRFGNRSRQNLARLVHGEEVHLDCYKADQYRRRVCRVHLGGRDVWLGQVRDGLAWWYRRYASEQTPKERREYESAESDARAGRVALWADKDAVPPWDWRRARRESRARERFRGPGRRRMTVTRVLRVCTAS